MVKAASEMPLVGREFHVLRSLIQEKQRLQAAPKTNDTSKKSEMLRVEIERLARQLDTAQQEMNAEEQRIIAEGLNSPAREK